MAYYKWTGINLLGEICKGKVQARSEQELDKILLKREIGLIKYKEIKPIFISLKIKNSDLIKFIQHLSILLKAEIRLADSLLIIINTTANIYLKNTLKEINSYILEGHSFSYALSLYPKIFDSVLIALVSVGEETGKLANILSIFSQHLENIDKYRKKLKSSLLMPIITFISFIFLMGIIFIFIIPRFKHFFLDIKGNLPTSTKIIFFISDFINSFLFLYFLFFVTTSLFVLVYFYKKNKGNLIFQKIIYSIPFLNKFLKFFYNADFLQNLSLLLNGGVHLPQALKIIISKTNNQFIKHDLLKINDNIMAGKTLSFSLKNSIIFSSQELITLIEVGENSGEIAKMIEQAALIYKLYVYAILERAITILQPLILVILGLLIASLILSIYLPLFSLSYLTC